MCPCATSVMMVAFLITVTSAHASGASAIRPAKRCLLHYLLHPAPGSSVAAPPRPPAGSGAGVYFTAIDEHHFHARPIVENLASRHHQVRDLALFDAAQPVRHAVDFRRRKRQRAHRIFARQSVVDGLLHGALNIARRDPGHRCKAQT